MNRDQFEDTGGCVGGGPAHRALFRSIGTDGPSRASGRLDDGDRLESCRAAGRSEANPKGRMLRVVGYVRVSVNEQAKHGVRLAAQEQTRCASGKGNGWPSVAAVHSC